MNIVAIVQARMGSSRFPNKVMADISGRSMLAQIVTRLRRATLIDLVVVATTIEPADHAIVEDCWRSLVSVTRGSETDLIGRIYKTAKMHMADVVVRITGDCPMTDPDVADKVIEKYLAGDWQYVCNVRPRTYPDGLNVEVYSIELLERLNNEIEDSVYREWFPVYIWDTLNPSLMYNVACALDYSNLRWTVDYPEDLEFVRCIYDRLGNDFRMDDVLALLNREPELAEINARPRDPYHNFPYKEKKIE